MEIIHIALATDESYVQHAGVMIVSLLYNKKSNNSTVIHVLGDELSKKSCSRLEEITQQYNAVINFWQIKSEKFQDLFKGPHKRTTNYFRLMLPDILPNEINKVLYLDVDMIVRKDITELWNTNIDKYHLAAVIDYPAEVMGRLPVFKSNLGIPKNESYFNSGLMLINISKWRKDGIGHKVVEFNRNNPDKLICTDQDGFNAILSGKWLRLDAKWNIPELPLQLYHGWGRNKLPLEITEGIKNPNIIHFTGTTLSRPWKYGCINPYAKEYWNYLKLTPWKGYSKSLPGNFKEWLDILWVYFKVLTMKSGQYHNLVKLWRCFKKV